MSKAILDYSLKSQNLEIKDLDEGSRTVAMYLAKFNILDSDRDIIRPGAFLRSISERGPGSSSNRKIAYLRYHNWQMPIGKFIELKEDEEGLYAVGQLGKSTNGMDAFSDYQDGIIREHSIGFRYAQNGLTWIPDDRSEYDGGHYEVTEVKLWEGSAVTFGANEHTNVVEVAKSQGRVETANEIAKEIGVLTGAIINGKGTDERLFGIEMRLKLLNSQMVQLATGELSKGNSKDELAQGDRGKESGGIDWSKIVQKL